MVLYFLAEDVYLICIFYKSKYFSNYSILYKILHVLYTFIHRLLQFDKIALLLFFFIVLIPTSIFINSKTLALITSAIFIIATAYLGILKEGFNDIVKWFNSIFIYYKINYRNCCKREYIYFIYFSLSEDYQKRFLSYLENNVSQVDGEWPNQDFLQAKKGHIRLAKLEEKWRGLAK